MDRSYCETMAKQSNFKIRVEPWSAPNKQLLNDCIYQLFSIQILCVLFTKYLNKMLAKNSTEGLQIITQHKQQPYKEDTIGTTT